MSVNPRGLANILNFSSSVLSSCRDILYDISKFGPSNCPLRLRIRPSSKKLLIIDEKMPKKIGIWAKKNSKFGKSFLELKKNCLED